MRDLVKRKNRVSWNVATQLYFIPLRQGTTKILKTHGGVMVARKNSVKYELLRTDQLDCSLTRKLEINNPMICICVSYNTPQGRRNRYVKEGFEKLIANVPQTKAALICGDIIFPNTNWSNFSSEDEEEHWVLELFENAFYQQGVVFDIQGTNTLAVAFLHNCSLFTSPDEANLRLLRPQSCKVFTWVQNCEEKAIL